MPEPMETRPKMVLKFECFDSEGKLRWTEHVEMREEIADGRNGNDRGQERYPE